MKEVTIYDHLEKFNSIYADRFPNYKLMIEAYHMVSYIKYSSINKLGTYKDIKLAEEKIKKIIDGGHKAWISEISHRLVIHNLISDKSQMISVSNNSGGSPIVWCVGGSSRNYKRYRASIKRYLSDKTELYGIRELVSTLDVKNNQPDSTIYRDSRVSSLIG